MNEETEITPSFTPYDDIGISDEEVTNAHQNLLEQHRYDEAVETIDENPAMNKKGIRASIMNRIEERIRQLQIHLLNKTAASDELYSLTQPTESQMNNKLFWIKPIE